MIHFPGTCNDYISVISVFLGAIFFENEQEIEQSFDHALREVNNLKFFEIQFVSIKRYMPTNDSFMLQQLSKCFHRADRIPNIKC